MIVLRTEIVPIFWVLLVAISALVIMFLIKVFLSDRLQRRIVTEKPIILLIGSPGTGKKKLIESLTGHKTKTKMYPFIGRFRISDVSLKGKDFRMLCFHSVDKCQVLKKENIQLFGRKPSIIIFVVRCFSDFEKMKQQGKVLKDIKKIFQEVPTIVAIDKRSEIIKKRMDDILQIFGKDMIDLSALETKKIHLLKSDVENYIKSD